MASNELEVLESAATTENVEESESGFAVTRRQLMSALTVAGAAAGIALVSGPTKARAQQPTPQGYNQIDVLNFLMNVKYLTATLYSYVTQGADLPAASFTTVGTGGVFNAPGKVTFSTPQITDLFNELYYDELNHLIDLRNLLGNAVVGRQTINLLGNGTTTNTQTSYTQSEVIALARMLEDVSVTAFTGSAIYLTGTNLDYASRVLAADGFHAGALRLVAIQTSAQYRSPAYSFGGVTAASQTAVSFTGVPLAGVKSMYAVLGTIPPVAGNILSGVGIPAGAGSVVTAVTSAANLTPSAIPTKSSNVLTLVSSLTSVAVGQPVSGTNIAAGSYITAFDPTLKTITLSQQASGSSTFSTTGTLANGSNVITAVASVNNAVIGGMVVGQPISGTFIAGTATITALDTKALTITMSLPASGVPTVKPTGVVTSGSAQVTALSSTSGLVAGAPITGTGIPTNTFIGAVSGNSLTLADSTGKNPIAATISSPITGSYTFSAITTAGSAVVTPTGAFSGIVVGQTVTGTGVPAGATITAFNTSAVTLSANATASSIATPTGITYIGSAVIANVSSTSGLISGQPITGTGVPANTTISSLGAGTITMSNPATQISTTPVTFTSPIAVTLTTKTSATVLTANIPATVTVPTSVALSIGNSVVTMAGAATASPTTSQTISVLTPDPLDVEPADPGTAAASAKGPQVIAGTSATPISQGFFNTAGSASATANTPAGFAFTRTFQQVIAVLLNTNSTNAIVATQNYQGGFYPVGISGNITSVT